MLLNQTLNENKRATGTKNESSTYCRLENVFVVFNLTTLFFKKKENMGPAMLKG
jgi:hypothetical protein